MNKEELLNNLILKDSAKVNKFLNLCINEKLTKVIHEKRKLVASELFKKKD